MKRINYLCVFVLIMFTSACWAYGGGSSSSKACDKPKFSNFVPTENAEVTAGSAFSFTASKNTYPTTIKVNVKEQAATIKVDKKNDGTFAVSGKLPASAKSGFARIAITADAQSNCKGTGGWLVKVAE
jgi:copper chaperone CopZ